MILDEPVIACMATVARRVDVLERVIKSLHPQVDVLNIYLNDHRDFPDYLRKYPKVNAVLHPDGDLGDVGKFWWSGKVEPSYYLTVDDDIIYPPDYTRKMCWYLSEFDGPVVVGVHGVVLDERVQDYYEDRTVLHFKDGALSLTPVHMLGTGTACFDSRHMPSLGEFERPNMADCYVGVWAQKNNTALYSVPRPSIWLEPIKVESSIYQSRTGGAQAKVLNRVEKWETHKAPLRYVPKRLSVLISAYKNEQWVGEAIQSVLDDSLPTGWSLEVLVGCDACPLAYTAAKQVEDERVKVLLFDENRGSYAVLNDLARLATGEYIAIRDSDDVSLKGSFVKLLRELRHPGMDMVGGQIVNVGEDGVPCAKAFPVRPFTSGRTNFYQVPHGWFFCIHGTRVQKRVVFFAAGSYFPERISSDYELNYRMYAMGLESCALSSVVLHRRVHGNAATRTAETGIGSPKRQALQKFFDEQYARLLKGEEPKYYPRLEVGKFSQP